MTEQLQGQIQNANHQGRHRSTRAGLRLHFNLTSFNIQRMFDYRIYKIRLHKYSASMRMKRPKPQI